MGGRQAGNDQNFLMEFFRGILCHFSRALVTRTPPNEILCPQRLPLLFYGVRRFMLTGSPSTAALRQGWGCHVAGSTSVIYEANMIAILLCQSQSSIGLTTTYIKYTNT